MEIKRKIEMLAVTQRRYVIRQAASGQPLACATCGAPMLTAEQAANFFGITHRRIFQLIETGTVHFTENEAGVVRICLKLLAEFLGSAQK